MGVRKTDINRYAGQAEGSKEVITKNADIPDIIDQILIADLESKSYDPFLALRLKGNSPNQTLYNIWDNTKRKVEYIRDEPGFEAVKNTARTFLDRFGDCKSMSVINGVFMHHLGIPYKYRVAFYDQEKNNGHIYPVAMIGGREVVVDSVVDFFDYEVRPTSYKDYWPIGAKAISGVPNTKNWLLAAATIFFLWRLS